ncbi:MAG: S9 family peptidase [Actinomycetota bacterium]|nr:S9 family peptidase [Actinomycetota bacterium]
MAAPQTLPHGAWPSPITSELITRSAAALGEVWPIGDAVWWSELRPEEGGRVVLVRRAADGTVTDALPEGYSARTRVHEYGGAAWWPGPDGSVVFANWDDQRLYLLRDGAAEPITPASPAAVPHGWRFADGRVIPHHERYSVCVRELHDDDLPEARNEIVAVSHDGEEHVVVLASGPDFVAAPRPSPDGRYLAWISWDHPAMPWDGTRLWVGELGYEDEQLVVHDARVVAGGDQESVIQPEWSPDGRLHYVSDGSNWWNVHAFETEGRPHGDATVHGVEAEVGVPAWQFGQSRYGFARDGRVVATWTTPDGAVLATFDDPVTHDAHVIELEGEPASTLASLRVVGERVLAIAASPVSEPLVVSLDLAPLDPRHEVLRPARDLGIDRSWYSVPRHVSFPCGDGHDSHAWYYPPVNPDVTAPVGEKPPLIVLSHGGPTGASGPELTLGIQYWTSRGFAVVDVNYGGSTGYGRAYRRRLDGRWGIVDVNDCICAARFLADYDEVDGERLLIRGGSAGGFTTLAALTSTELFAAGTSRYGVADLAALAADTHKFESRYLDTLVGPYPEAESIYAERSPINHTDELSCPLLLLQGAEDEIVPPAQSEQMAAALDAKGIPYAYVLFEGEQHGFRRAENIRRSIDLELAFYARVLGFEVAGGAEPLELHHEEALKR